MSALRGYDADVHAALGARLGDRYVGWTGPEYVTRFGGGFLRRAGGRPSMYVAHHSAGSHRHTGADLWRYHVRRLGWATTGYHIVVRHDGTVEMMVPPSRLAYGAGRRWNDTTVHVCLPGNYHRRWEERGGVRVDVAHEPPPGALDAMYQVFCALDDQVGYAPWRGHRQLKATACPGDRLMPHVERMRGGDYGAADPRPRHYPM